MAEGGWSTSSPEWKFYSEEWLLPPEFSKNGRKGMVRDWNAFHGKTCGNFS